MTAGEQVEKVAKALFAWDIQEHEDPRPTWEGSEGMRKVFRSGATVAIAAMQPEPVTVTTVEELRALPDGTAVLLPNGDMARRWHFRDGSPGLKLILADLGRQGDLSLSFGWPGVNYESYLPATVLHPVPTPQAEVLHITGPSETGDLAPMLCGITKVVETPRSPEQPVCQACSAIQMSERNDLDQRAKAQADVLAEVREWCDAENKGKNPTERRIIDNCADDILAILDKHVSLSLTAKLGL